MFSKKYVLLIVLGLSLTSTPGCLPAPPGMDLYAYQYTQVNPTSQMRIPLQLTPVSGNWSSDIGYNADAQNEGTYFNVVLSRTAQAHVNNTRLPARWIFTIGHICVHSVIVEEIADVHAGEVASVVL